MSNDGPSTGCSRSINGMMKTPGQENWEQPDQYPCAHAPSKIFPSAREMGSEPNEPRTKYPFLLVHGIPARTVSKNCYMSPITLPVRAPGKICKIPLSNNQSE